MKYCKNTTLEHPTSLEYPACITDYNQLIADEGYMGGDLFTNEEIVLNLDLVEKEYSTKIGREEKNRSMDSAFCVLNNESKKIVLVEYKFNKEEFKYLKLTEMDEKVAGSIKVVGDQIPIYYNYYFVFQKDLLCQAIYRLNRMNPKPRNEYVAISIELLKDKFF